MTKQELVKAIDEATAKKDFATAQKLQTELDALPQEQAAQTVINSDESLLGKEVTLRGNPNRLRNVDLTRQPIEGNLVNAYERVSRRTNNPYYVAKVTFKALENGVNKEFVITAPVSSIDERNIVFTSGMTVNVHIVENTFNGTTRKQAEFVIGE